MRVVAPGAAFAFVVMLAACAGGSGTTPPAGGPGTGTGPSQDKSTRATMVLHVPPASAQNPASKHRFYVSPGTQSFGVWVFPYGSTATPGLSNVQLFPVATPSPCASAIGGGEVCTLVVTAPIGGDVFYLAAFGTTNPTAATVPLDVYESGLITVGGPNPNPTPLNFSLNAVPNTVAISVPSPDPGNTPNTQVFTAGAASSVPLGLSATDASGNQILADPVTIFSPAITVSVTPSNSGIGLQLSSQCHSSGLVNGLRPVQRRRATSSASSVTISCFADLSNVALTYDGSVNVDSSDDVIDAVAIAAPGVAASPVPTPAYAVLQSNVTTNQVALPAQFTAFDGWLTPAAGGQLIYLLSGDSSGLVGTFTPSTGALGAPVTLSTVVDPTAATVGPDGSYWVVDSNTTIDCWASYTSAESGAAPTQITPSGSPSISSIAIDGSGDTWYTGYIGDGGTVIAGFFPEGGCAVPGSFSSPVVLNGDNYDSSPNAVGLSNGVAYNSDSSGLFVVTTASSGSVNAIEPVIPGEGVGAAVDGSQNVYASFEDTSVSGDIERLSSGGSALTQLLLLVPTTAISYYGPDPASLAVFSGSGGVADRAAYAEDDFGAIGSVASLSTTPVNTLAGVPNLANLDLWQVTYASTGIPYGIYPTASYGAAVAGAIQTTTWNVPVTTVNASCNDVDTFTIDERGDSGPFTWSPSSGVTAFPGTDHVFDISPPAYGTPFTETVTDAHGRAETYTLIVNSATDC